jgi:hypothetical protein
MEHGAWSMEHGAWSMEHGAEGGRRKRRREGERESFKI